MRPFNPVRDTENLRRHLCALSDYHGVSTPALLHSIDDLVRKTGAEKLKISVASVNKFKNGERSIKIDELSRIWDFIHDNFDLEDFDKIDEMAVSSVISPSLYTSLRECFSERFDLFPSFTLESLAPYVIGSYTMYRRDPSPQTDGDAIFVSGLMIWFEGTDALIAEVRAVPQNDGTSALYALHEGAVFTRGTFIHFVMKEAAGVGMMFGTIDRLWPLTTDSHVRHMTGSVYIVRAEGVMPSCRFYCELLADGEYVKSGVFDADEIENRSFINNI